MNARDGGVHEQKARVARVTSNCEEPCTRDSKDKHCLLPPCLRLLPVAWPAIDSARRVVGPACRVAAAHDRGAKTMPRLHHVWPPALWSTVEGAPPSTARAELDFDGNRACRMQYRVAATAQLRGSGRLGETLTASAHCSVLTPK